MNSEKLINSFEIKRLPDYLLNSYFVCKFVNNFSALLLYKINIIDFFNMGVFFSFFISRNTELLNESKYWLGMYVTCIINRHTRTEFFSKSLF